MIDFLLAFLTLIVRGAVILGILLVFSYFAPMWLEVLAILGLLAFAAWNEIQP